MKITCAGHACIFIEAEKNIITDPFISGNPQCGLSLDGLPKTDVILLTHGHGDHLGDTAEIAKRDGSLVVAPVELAVWLNIKGVKAHPMNFGSKDLGFGRLSMVTATHSSSVSENGSAVNTGNACGYVIRTGGKTIYFAGDTGLSADMALLADEKPDLAFLPVGGNYTMDAEDAVRAARMIKPALCVPIHYDTMPAITLKEKERLLLQSEGFLFLKPGEAITL